MTNTQLLYSQHLENVRHNRATEEAKMRDIENTARQLDITEAYNRENLDIQRLKAMQDYAISQAANELRRLDLTNQQQRFVDSWEQNAKRQSAELAKTQAETERIYAQTDQTMAKTVQESPIGYLAVKGWDKVSQLPGATQILETLWPANSSEARQEMLDTGEQLVTSRKFPSADNYTAQQKLDIADRVSDAIKAVSINPFKAGRNPNSQEELWLLCAPKEEVMYWKTLSNTERKEAVGQFVIPWKTDYWKEQYKRYIMSARDARKLSAEERAAYLEQE